MLMDKQKEQVVKSHLPLREKTNMQFIYVSLHNFFITNLLYNHYLQILF